MKIEKQAERRQQLKEVAFFLEGLKQGKGNLLPLGTNHLDALWAVIQLLEER